MGYLRYYLGNALMLLGVAGFALGGGWVWLGAGTFPLLVVLDLPFPKADFSVRSLKHPRLADVPLYVHGVLLYALLGLGAWRIGHILGSPSPSVGQLAGCVLSVGWLGVLPNIPVAHELLHRHGWWPRLWAHLMSAAIADPIRRLAHLRGHHVQFGLPEDSDTARRGESLYAFMVRAAVASSVGSIRDERARLQRLGRSPASLHGDLARSLGLQLALLAAFAAIGGWGAAGLLFLAFVVSKFLLEGFNYFQHYGLVRAPSARHHPRHTWSHLTPVVRAVAYEITNHAQHHMDQQVPFHRLVPDRDAPQMPSIVLCFLAALVPPVWTRLIAQPALRHWDLHFANPEERALAAQANAAAGWPDWLSEGVKAAA